MYFLIGTSIFSQITPTINYFNFQQVYF